MPTITPARRFYEIEYDYGLWWEQAPLGSIFPSSDILLVSSTGDLITPTEYARCAIQFKTNTPAWAAVGDLTEANAVLWMYLENYAHYGGIGNILIGDASGAWNMSSTQPTMRGMGVGSWTAFMTPKPNHEHGWVGFVLDTTSGKLRNGNGIIMKVALGVTPASFKFLKNPPPMGRAYISVDIANAISGSATDRLEIDAEHIAALENSTGVFAVGTEIQQEQIFPSRNDVEIELGKGSAVVNRATPHPESWKMTAPDLGALTFSRSEVDLHDYRGSIIELLLTIQVGQTAAVTLLKQYGVLGEVDKGSVSQEVLISDPLFEAMKMTPYFRDPILGMEGVNILTEPRLYAMLEILINGAGLAWERVRQEDLYWLLSRFATIWDRMTVTAVDMVDYTVDEFIQEVGAQYALAFSRGSDDAIVVWHPAVYRPSLKVHTVNDTELSNVHYKKEAGKDTYDIAKVQTTPVVMESALPTRIDARDQTYHVENYGGCFDTYQAARYSLAKQLAQKVVADYEIYTFTAGTRAAAWENGDKLKITSKKNVFTDKVFTLIDCQGNPNDGVYECIAIHWPHSPGFQSTWRNTGLMGIWRLWAWDTWLNTGANQSPIGTAGAMTVTTITNILHLDWRGVVANVTLTAPTTFAPDSGGGSSKYDMVDFVLTIIGEQATDPTGGLGDPMWTNILRFTDSGNNKAVYCGIKRVSTPKPPPTPYYSPCDLRMFLGYTLDKTLNPLGWVSKTESPPGFANADHEWSYGVAVQWHNETLRLYVDRILIGEISVASYNFDTVNIVTPIGTEHKIGCIRWLQNSDDWFSPEQCVGSMGQDNYYP
jgi:hypothetical protein